MTKSITWSLFLLWTRQVIFSKFCDWQWIFLQLGPIASWTTKIYQEKHALPTCRNAVKKLSSSWRVQAAHCRVCFLTASDISERIWCGIRLFFIPIKKHEVKFSISSNASRFHKAPQTSKDKNRKKKFIRNKLFVFGD